jgi:predicted acylesterase/phospholipase RssA
VAYLGAGAAEGTAARGKEAAMADKRLAFVFSGGGAKGAFGVGVLWQLAQSLPALKWNIVSGTSTGALMTPLAAIGSDHRKALDALRDLYVGIRQDHILDSNLGGLEILKAIVDIPEGLYNFDPLKKLLPKVMTEARREKLFQSDVVAILNSVNLETGALSLWTQRKHKKTLKAWFEAHTGKSDLPVDWIPETMLESAMCASSAIPAAIEPETIEGVQHVDGGVVDLAPLRAAVAAGATHILTVMMSPRVAAPDPGKKENLLQVAIRAIDMLSDEIGRNDVEVARETTLLQPLADILTRTPPAGLPAPLQDWMSHPENAKLVAGLAARRQIQVEVIEPKVALGSTLDFDSKVKPGWPDVGGKGDVPIMQARFEIGRQAAKESLEGNSPIASMLAQFA